MNDTITQYPVSIYNKEDKPYEVWETIIIPLIIGPLVLLIKIMYDRNYNFDTQNKIWILK